MTERSATSSEVALDLKEVVEDVRREVAAVATSEGDLQPEPLLRFFALKLDEVISRLFEESKGFGRTVALVALGGYGRQELYPYSDVDLLVVHQQVEEAVVDDVVERVIYPLWDAKLQVGHAVRDVAETLDLAKEDLTMRTSLLDARLVAGDRAPFQALQAGAVRELFGSDHASTFRELLLAERAQRHQRFGKTIYLIEPHIKNGMGGLRDVNTALWAAKARHGIGTLDRLAEVELATSRQQQQLVDAVRFLQRLRLVAHVDTGRSQDRLIFELQERLAVRLVPDTEIPGAERRKVPTAVAPAVERLMHAYYQAARTVVLESEAILERCFPLGTSAPAQPVEGHFEARGGQLESSAPQDLWNKPADLLRAVELADQHQLRMERSLRDAVEEAAAGTPGAQLPADGDAAEVFLRLLASPQRSDARPALEELHDLGILVAILPEFAACTGRVQHDLYHVFTVDRHSLYVVELIKEWIAGRRGDVNKRGVEVVKHVEDTTTLLLGALLHDVGKPFGADHAGKGARLAAGIAARLGLPAGKVEEVSFLVREHLVMQHISQRRDLSDGTLIAGFAEKVANVQQLRRLYVLALADTAMTAPGNLSEWKASLLDELFRRCEQRLRWGAAGEQGEVARQRGVVTERLAAQVGEDRSVVRRFLRRLPDAFFSAGDAEELTHHAAVAWDMLRVGDSLLRVGFRQTDDATVAVTICCADRPRLLATITGVLLLERLTVRGARVYTIPLEQAPPTSVPSRRVGDGYDRPVALTAGSGHMDEAPSGLVLDIFWVPLPDEGEEALRSFSRSLHEALSGESNLAARLAEVLNDKGAGDRVLPRVETRVTISNTASERATVIDIQTSDRQGLLHVVTRTLSDLQLNISVARVATEAGKVVDSFYVTDRHSGGKLKDPRRLATVRAALMGVVNALPRESTPIEQSGGVRRPSSTSSVEES